MDLNLVVGGLLVLINLLAVAVMIFIQVRQAKGVDQDQLLLTFKDSLLENWEKFFKENRDNSEKLISKLHALDNTLMAKNSEGLIKLNSTLERHHTHLLKENTRPIEKLYQVLQSFEESVSGNQTKNFDKFRERVESSLSDISHRVRESLDDGFKRTSKTFTEVMSRISRIDQAQKKIEQLSTDVVSLQEILTDKKSRGIFGEVQLEHMLASVFGEKNDSVYRLQYTLTNKKIVDAFLLLPGPLGNICVDAKFPLENYRRMCDKGLSEVERENAWKEFKKNVKKHINDIADKYIILGETTDQAIMFLPAEAIFAELHAYHNDLIIFAQKRSVWITSPTTFFASLSIIQVTLKDIERSKYAHVIQEQLGKLALDFKRYRERWDHLASHIETVSKDVKSIHTTSDKISSEFERIKEVEFHSNGAP